MMQGMACFEASVLVLLLSSIALIHAYWAVGGTWPGVDRADLKSKVLGGPEDQPFPSAAASLMLAGAASFGAFVALKLGGVLPGAASGSYRGLAWGMTLLFLARGLAGYGMHRMSFWKESPAFNDLNQKIYSPLCLAIALLSGLLAGRAFFL